MVYAGILAGGIGVRMHRADLPKPFLMLGTKPIIIHTLEQFTFCAKINRIIVVVPSGWEIYAEDLITKWLPTTANICAISGGENKNQSIKKLVEFIDSEWGINDDDIIVNHDAIRPFVTYRIISENVEIASKYGAANTLMPTVDTIVKSIDSTIISEIPVKRYMYSEQTPQTFNIKKLKSAYDIISDEIQISETDTARLMLNSGYDVHIVLGEYSNMKIITPYDLEVANALLKDIKHD